MAEHNPSGAAELGQQLLVLRCQAGDERAFAQLMDHFGGRTLRYLRGLVGEAAEDVQQEVWLTVYRSIASLANPRAFRTWLFRTTRNRALDFLREQKRETELIVNTPLETLDIPAPLTPGDDREITESMLDALDTLAPAHREVCVLRYRDDLSYAEIALVVGCSVGTVRSRLHYAKQHLHDAINTRTQQ
jgi:RNA polymerase sigma-70 factor (ECF subfamily)